MVTYAVARANILSALRAQDWTLSGDLKVPHATSPDGAIRFWFRSQAVYFTTASRGERHQPQSAYSLDQACAVDIRKYSAEAYIRWAVKRVTALDEASRNR